MIVKIKDIINNLSELERIELNIIHMCGLVNTCKICKVKFLCFSEIEWQKGEICHYDHCSEDCEIESGMFGGRKPEGSKEARSAYSSLSGRSKEKVISKNEFVKWYDNEEKICCYCGISVEEIERIDDRFLNKSKRLTIDRIDSNKGYESGNLALACFRCNVVKSDFFTKKEMKKIGEEFVSPRWKGQLNG